MHEAGRPAGSPRLPNPPLAQGNYVPASVLLLTPGTRLVHTAGMTPRLDGALVATGTVGACVDVAQAAGLARIAAANALAAVAARCGGLDDVVCLQLTVYIAAVAGFTAHSAVADGASAELLDRLGTRGAVARSAVGVASLPSGAPVEVSLVAAIAPEGGAAL